MSTKKAASKKDRASIAVAQSLVDRLHRVARHRKEQAILNGESPLPTMTGIVEATLAAGLKDAAAMRKKKQTPPPITNAPVEPTTTIRIDRELQQQLKTEAVARTRELPLEGRFSVSIRDVAELILTDALAQWEAEIPPGGRDTAIEASGDRGSDEI